MLSATRNCGWPQIIPGIDGSGEHGRCRRVTTGEWRRRRRQSISVGGWEPVRREVFVDVDVRAEVEHAIPLGREGLGRVNDERPAMLTRFPVDCNRNCPLEFSRFLLTDCGDFVPIGGLNERDGVKEVVLLHARDREREDVFGVSPLDERRVRSLTTDKHVYGFDDERHVGFARILDLDAEHDRAFIVSCFPSFAIPFLGAVGCRDVRFPGNVGVCFRKEDVGDKDGAHANFEPGHGSEGLPVRLA